MLRLPSRLAVGSCSNAASFCSSGTSGNSSSARSLLKSLPRPPNRNPRVSPKIKKRLHRVRQWTDPDPERSSIYATHFKEYEEQLNALMQLAHYELHGCIREVQQQRQQESEMNKSDSFVQLRDYWQQQQQQDAAAPSDELFAEAERLNSEWNIESGRLREAEMRQQLQLMRDEADQRQLQYELQQQQTVLSFQQRLQVDIRDSPDFVCAENLDAKVEEILDSDIVGFNFAINPAGEIIKNADANS